jgi:hypothetical protein
MLIPLYKPTMRIALLVAVVTMLVPVSFASTMVEYGILLILADGAAGVAYQACGYNPTDEDQTAVLEIDYSDSMLGSETVELPLAAGATDCVNLEPYAKAAIKWIVPILPFLEEQSQGNPDLIVGGFGSNVLIGSGACGLPAGLLPPVIVQLTVQHNGVPVALLLPAVQAARETNR